MSVAAHLKIQISVLGEHHAKPRALLAYASIHSGRKIVLCVGRDKCPEYVEKVLPVVRLHALEQDVAPNAVSDSGSDLVKDELMRDASSYTSAHSSGSKTLSIL
jgi:hypothetical protein